MPKINLYPDKLGILVTNRCPANCDICCFCCSPEKTDNMSEFLLEKCIDEAIQSPKIKTVGFSGGEPFLQFERILALTYKASSNGLGVSCTTNGFWAKDRVVAEEKIKKLKHAGLKKISVSFDLFHQQFIPTICIKNILELCNKYEILTDMGSVITKSRNDLGSIMCDIQNQMVGVPHYYAACLPVGNAKSRISPDDLIYDPYILTRKSQCLDLDFFAVYPNEKNRLSINVMYVTACCQTKNSLMQSSLLSNKSEKKYTQNTLKNIKIKHWFTE